MPLNEAGINAILDNGNEAVIYAAIGNGGQAGDEVSSARVALALSTPSGGIISATGTPLAFTGTPSSPATHVLLFSAATDGTFYGSEPLSGGQTFSAEGNYWINSLTITGLPG